MNQAQTESVFLFIFLILVLLVLVLLHLPSCVLPFYMGCMLELVALAGPLLSGSVRAVGGSVGPAYWAQESGCDGEEEDK